MADFKNPQNRWTDRIVLSTNGKEKIILGNIETNLRQFSLEPGTKGVTRKFRIKWKLWKLWGSWKSWNLWELWELWRNWCFYKKISFGIHPIIDDTYIRIETWFSSRETVGALPSV
jgi:hypothetical protein